MASKPYNLIAAPFTVWSAPVGEVFPDLADAPSGNWTKIGTSGDLEYGEEGVTVTHQQTVEVWRGLGSTGARKAMRTEEGLMVAFTLHDLTLSEYAKAMNGNTVTASAAGAGAAGTDDIDLYRGLDVSLVALLVRGNASPGGAGFSMQYQVPVAFQNASPEPVFTKGAPAGLALEFMALEDPDASTAADRFGKLVVQTAAAS